MPEPLPALSTSRNCPYCEGNGCSECGDTGTRVTTTMQTPEGASVRVSGNAPLDAESQKAVAALARVAGMLMNPTSEAKTFHQALCSSCGNPADFDGWEWRTTAETAVEAAVEAGWERKGELLLCENCAGLWCESCGGPCRDEDDDV